MNNSQHTVSRRQALAGIGVASAVAMAPAALAAAPTDRTAWVHAVAALDSAERHMNATSMTWSAAHSRCEALKPPISSASKRPMPWAFLDERDIQFSFDTKQARDLVARCQEPDRSRYLAALDSIDRYREGCERARVACNMEAHSKAVDAAGEAFGDAEVAMFQTPAPDLDALHFKLDRMFGEKARTEDGDPDFAPGWHVKTLGPVMDDARRLLAGR